MLDRSTFTNTVLYIFGYNIRHAIDDVIETTQNGVCCKTWLSLMVDGMLSVGKTRLYQ